MSWMTTHPSRRPKVSQVNYWDDIFVDSTENWKGQKVSAKVELGVPYPDFYRVTYIVDGSKKSKLFYGESAHNQTEMYVYDLGFRNVLGRI